MNVYKNIKVSQYTIKFIFNLLEKEDKKLEKKLF